MKIVAASLGSFAIIMGPLAAFAQSPTWSKAEDRRAEQMVEQCAPTAARSKASAACVGRATAACWHASKTTQQARACDDFEYRAWERRLHDEEDHFRKLLSPDDLSAFNNREKAWLKFVEDDCWVQSEHNPYGSGTLADLVHCEMVAVAERTAALSRNH
jgi:uncharacterized protein YecT (DUF1311 family)